MVLDELEVQFFKDNVAIHKDAPGFGKFKEADKVHQLLFKAAPEEFASAKEGDLSKKKFTLTFSDRELGILGAREMVAQFTEQFENYIEEKGSHPFSVHPKLGNRNQLVVEVDSRDEEHIAMLEKLAASQARKAPAKH